MIFWLSDRTLRRVRIFGCRVEFGLGMAGQYKQQVQYGKGPPIKAGQPEPSPACENHHIYEDLTESSSARPGRKSAAGDSAEPKQ
jgi:hypothetical protein